MRFVNRKDAEDCLLNRKNLRQLNNSEVGIGVNTKTPFMSKLAYTAEFLKVNH